MTHLFISDDGNLYDTRNAAWSSAKPLRANYCHTKTDIATVADLKATLRNGGYAWPGGYPLYFITNDGAALSFETVRREFRIVADAIRQNDRSGWRVVGCDINYEDDDLFCDHSGDKIESAYGQDEARDNA
jgi:hypothetical protein